MSILEDVLVQKYFGCNHWLPSLHSCREATAARLIDAMQADMKKGDLYLYFLNGQARLGVAEWDPKPNGFHFCAKIGKL
jgi:hypothetical protein